MQMVLPGSKEVSDALKRQFVSHCYIGLAFTACMCITFSTVALILLKPVEQPFRYMYIHVHVLASVYTTIFSDVHV